MSDRSYLEEEERQAKLIERLQIQIDVEREHYSHLVAQLAALRETVREMRECLNMFKDLKVGRDKQGNFGFTGFGTDKFPFDGHVADLGSLARAALVKCPESGE
jgi:hypothetical protein